MPAMRLTPSNCQLLGEGLDHPESVCLGPDGTVYAGGEAGQVYRLDTTGGQHLVGTTGGFLLGLTLDGAGAIHACDVGNKALVRMSPEGKVTHRATGIAGRPFVNPNHILFDPQGTLYLTDSGDYWQQETGTGYVATVDAQDNAKIFHAGPFMFANGIALHPSGEWLYIAQSTAANIVRIPLARPNGPMEVTHTLPTGTVPDGIAFAADSRLVIGCYKPDAILVGHPDGTVETLFEDPTGELLNRPTNIAIGEGKLYIANLGGWHLTVVEADFQPAPIHRPRLMQAAP